MDVVGEVRICFAGKFKSIQEAQDWLNELTVGGYINLVGGNAETRKLAILSILDHSAYDD